MNQTAPQVPDKRYRVLIMLRRADRPKYWDFHCPYCRAKVVEINNAEIYGIDDAVDVSSKRTTGMLCPGQYKNGCSIWFYFEGV